MSAIALLYIIEEVAEREGEITQWDLFDALHRMLVDYGYVLYSDASLVMHDLETLETLNLVSIRREEDGTWRIRVTEKGRRVCEGVPELIRRRCFRRR